MELNPRTILTAIKANEEQVTTPSIISNLRRVAKYLTNECQLKPDVDIESLASQCKSVVSTVKRYIKVFRDAFLYVTEPETHTNLVEKARKGSQTGAGILSLLGRDITSLEKYESFQRQHLRQFLPKGRVGRPPKAKLEVKRRVPLVKVAPVREWRSLTQIEDENRELRGEVKTLNTTRRNLMGTIEDLKRQLSAAQGKASHTLDFETLINSGIPQPLKGADLAEQLSRFFSELSKFSGQSARCVELANRLRELSHPEPVIDLPSTAVWQQKGWATIELSEEAMREFKALSPTQKELLRNALRHLSLDIRHPSLHTKKPYAPVSGIPTEAYYSRASSKIRFYWTAKGAAGMWEDVILSIHRIEVKRG